jgi:hypothetical protein
LPRAGQFLGLFSQFLLGLLPLVDLRLKSCRALFHPLLQSDVQSLQFRSPAFADLNLTANGDPSDYQPPHPGETAYDDNETNPPRSRLGSLGALAQQPHLLSLDLLNFSAYCIEETISLNNLASVRGRLPPTTFGDDLPSEFQQSMDLGFESIQSSLLIRIVHRQMSQHALVRYDSTSCSVVLREG